MKECPSVSSFLSCSSHTVYACCVIEKNLKQVRTEAGENMGVYSTNVPFCCKLRLESNIIIIVSC